MSRTVYDDATKAHAMKLATQLGPAEAARRTGIRSGTIASWMSRAGIATHAAENLRAAAEVRTATHEARRAELAETMLLIAERAAQQELAKLEDAPLFQVVGSRTRAIHDHQLLTGHATSRTESRTEEVHTLIAELTERQHA